MSRRFKVLPFSAPLLALLIAGCSSEDPRLPQQLYDQATQLSREGKNLEAKALLERLAQRFPESKPGQEARKDLVTIDAFLRQELQDTQRKVRTGMKRIADALTRYKEKSGQYPASLQALVPEYLDQVPEAPWGHPFLYHPYVSSPIEDVRDRRGQVSQRFNTRLDAYQLVSLGTDIRPGGDALAADLYIVNGDFHNEKTLPKIPMPQPLR